LKAYYTTGLRPYVIAGKFKEQDPADISVRESAFSAEAFRALCGEEKAKGITSIAMFYEALAAALAFHSVTSFPQILGAVAIIGWNLTTAATFVRFEALIRKSVQWWTSA
jgi:hypothetical protein